MKRPTPAPDMFALYQELSVEGQFDPKLLYRLNTDFNDPAPDGKYRHWHKLQYLTPPSGLTHKTWWLAIKLARNGSLKPFPLSDTRNQTYKFAMPDILQEMVHRIDRRASGTLAGDHALPSGDETRSILMRSLVEEPITSSQLEGAATTRKAAKKMLREGRPAQDKSERMILNNHLAMRFIREKAKHQPLTPELVFELHRLITEGTLDDPSAVGRFRTQAEDIAVVNEAGEVLHDPPPAAELGARLEAMCAFANDESNVPFVHPVVRSVLLHFWLAYDHPFVDGNGRTARALFYWSMARRGYWLIEYTSISSLLLRARTPYNRAFLYAESDGNDATYFVLHQCRTILKAIDDLYAYLNDKMEESRQGREILRNSGALALGLNHRQLALVRHAMDHPGTQYTIKMHRQYHHVSYQTARTDLIGIADLGLLHQAKVGKALVLVSPDDLTKRLGNYRDEK